MLFRTYVCCGALLCAIGAMSAQDLHHVQQRTTAGVLEGAVSADGKVRSFLGIPYAAPPVGAGRWKPPQPVAPWTGVRPALEFGPRPMQGRIYDDMVFRDSGPSEDCLYLNVWIPEGAQGRKLPVMVWIFGGGFQAGATSEPRQDGSMLCQKGVIVVSMNYRLGLFGFFAHPELTKESAAHASGNYGLMDQIAALRWVRDNIAAFGGDPANVTIFGESAGSYSVSAMVASPLARGLFHRAIGESGALVANSGSLPERDAAERKAVTFAQSAFGTSTLAALRALPAKELLAATLRRGAPNFGACVDGDVLPGDPVAIFRSGRQAQVPLLAGWNRDEGSWKGYFGRLPPTLANFREIAERRYPARVDAFLKVYHATNDIEAKRAAADLEGDNFIAFATWKWLELHRETGNSPVYRYEFDETLPPAPDAPPGGEPVVPHAADIEFVFRNLPARHLPWRPEDRETSELMAAYWTNFAKTGNPNGPGLPAWPRYDQGTAFEVMHLAAKPVATPDQHRDRYLFLDAEKR